VEKHIGEEKEEDEEAQLLSDPPTVSSRFFDEVLRFLSVTIILLLVAVIVGLTVAMLFQGVAQVKDNWSSYRQGLQRLERVQDDFVDKVGKEIRMNDKLDEKVKQAYRKLLVQAEDALWVGASELASALSEGISHAFLLLLYVMFWLMQPLPTSGKVVRIVRSYLLKKTFVSFLYGSCVMLLFFAMGIDLAILFGLISFLLNFIPEVGSFVSMIIPMPVILLDGRIEQPFLVLALATAGQIFLKFVFANVLEVILIEQDKEMKLHPVWIILGLCYFGFVWGPIGMLMSVPLLALMKSAALSAQEIMDEDEALCIASKMLSSSLEGRNPWKVGKQMET